MLYLNEISKRVLFFFFSLFLTLGVTYIYHNDFVFILSLPTLKQNFMIEYFIFTTPHEIFQFTIMLCIFFSFFFLFPYVVWLFIDFIRPALKKEEHKYFVLLCKYFISAFFFFNIIIFFFFCPLFWNFFSLFSLENTRTIYKFFFELRAIMFYDFILNVMILSNFLFILSNFYALTVVIFKRHQFFTKKKYFVLIILLVSTILTPPALEIQIILFICLYMCLEFFYFFFFFFLIYKGNQLNVSNNEETKITEANDKGKKTFHPRCIN